MTTALQLVTSSLRKLGAVAAGEAPDADEQADALAALNQIVESWNLQGLALYRRENVAYSLVPSQQVYTIGSGANFNGARPITINGAFVTRGGIDYPVEVLTQRSGTRFCRSRFPRNCRAPSITSRRFQTERCDSGLFRLRR
jgi:hypothetical protein